MNYILMNICAHDAGLILEGQKTLEIRSTRPNKSQRGHDRLAVTNFTKNDTHTTLTYAADKRPDSPEEAWRDFRNFMRHIREKSKAAGIEKPECLAVMEWQEADPENGKKAVAPHFHVLLRCQLSRDEIENCWHKKGTSLGRANADRLQLDKGSLEALANYMMKNPNRKHRYYRSRGIRNPVMPPPPERIRGICGPGW